MAQSGLTVFHPGIEVYNSFTRCLACPPGLLRNFWHKSWEAHAWLSSLGRGLGYGGCLLHEPWLHFALICCLIAFLCLVLPVRLFRLELNSQLATGVDSVLERHYRLSCLILILVITNVFFGMCVMTSAQCNTRSGLSHRSCLPLDEYQSNEGSRTVPIF